MELCLYTYINFPSRSNIYIFKPRGVAKLRSSTNSMMMM